MKKRNWEIWVSSSTQQNKCVALFEDTAERAELYLQYAEDSYGPQVVVTLKTKAGNLFQLNAARKLVAVHS